MSVRSLMTATDIAPLLDLAADLDHEDATRIQALRIAARLPLDESAVTVLRAAVASARLPARIRVPAATAAPEVNAPTPTVPEIDLFVRIVDMHSRGWRLPRDVEQLRTVGAEMADRMLTYLLDAVLSAGSAEATAAVTAVVTELTRGGARLVSADLPDRVLQRVERRPSAWLGALLTLVQPAQVIRLLADDIRGGAAETLGALHSVVRQLGRPRMPLLPPGSRNRNLTDLARVVIRATERSDPDRDTGRWLPAHGGDTPVSSDVPDEALFDDAYLVDLDLDLDDHGAADTQNDVLAEAPPNWSPPRMPRPPGRVRTGAPRATRPPHAPTAPPAPAPSAPASEPAEPSSNETYARLDAPERVDPGAEFELTVGIGEQPSPGVVQAAPFALPAGDVELTVRLMASGFRLRGSGTWERTLRVTEDDPYPFEKLRVVALADGFAELRMIVAEFRIADLSLGYAVRTVRVAADSGILSIPPAVPSGSVWVLPDAIDRPDVEITIAPANDAAAAGLVWSVRSKHADVSVPAAPVHSTLPDDATWARQNLRAIEERQNTPGFRAYLLGVAGQAGDAIPAAVWSALRDAARVVEPAPPTVLLATWEPYMPWELAAVPGEPWLADAPVFLGAQTVIGRWSYSEQLRTPSPPPAVTLDSMAVVTGDYAGSRALLHANQEAAELTQLYGAQPVDAEVSAVLACIDGTPPASALHFAVHGAGASTGSEGGLLMSDGRTYVEPTSLRGVGVSRGGKPIPSAAVFLNACQVGQSSRTLGEYAGMAAAFIGLGAGAVVAPLWKVDDSVAREVALAFYQAVLADGISPAEQLRRERVAAGDVVGSPAGTRLAYVYFGHPTLRVTWTGKDDDG